MKLEYRVTDKKGNEYKLWAYGEHSSNNTDKLNIKDVVINTLDLSLEPFTITQTGNFKHDNNNNAIYEIR